MILIDLRNIRYFKIRAGGSRVQHSFERTKDAAREIRDIFTLLGLLT